MASDGNAGDRLIARHFMVVQEVDANLGVLGQAIPLKPPRCNFATKLISARL